MLDYSSKFEQQEIPDPYFGNDGFDLVFDMIDDAAIGLLREIRSRHKI
jgi:protein-tyrosine phosphatase